jgi:dTDP-D-glucose 4,6-dehydratase
LRKPETLVQAYWTCDPDKAGQELGYWSELSLKGGFQRTVDWYRAERWIK